MKLNSAPLRRRLGEAFSRLRAAHEAHPKLYLLWCFLVPALLMMTVHAVYGVYPFGQNSVLVLDLHGQYVYYFAALRRAVFGDFSFLYSFARNLGGEFLGIYAYYLASPLSYIVCLFPADMLTEALYTILVLKCGLSGLTCAWFLHRTAGLRPLSVFLFSMCYALSGYAMIMQHNTMWIDALLLLPLVCLGVHSLIREKRFKLFISTFSLALLANYYIGYMLCIFLLVYFFYCLFSMSPEERNPRGERLHELRALIRMGVCSLISILIAAIIIFPAYYSLQFGKKGFSTPTYDFISKFDLFDLFGLFLFNSYDTVRPEGLPIVYAGLLTLFLLPFYYLSRRISLREKVAGALITFFMVFSFSIKSLDLVWHGFQTPNWLNYRYSFMLIFLLVVMAAKAFDKISRESPRAPIAVGTTIVFLILIAQYFSYDYLDDYAGVYPNIALTVVYAALLFLMIAGTLRRRAIARAVLSVLLTVELFVSLLLNLVHLDLDVVVSNRDSYLSFYQKWQPVIDWVEEQDTDPFYRTETPNHWMTNDPFSLGYYGISGSTSTLNASVIHFLSKIGYSASAHWAQYCASFPVSDSLIGIRYLFVNGTSSWKMPEIYERIYYDGERAVYKNPYALPLAFPVNEMINSLTIVEPEYDEEGNTDEERDYYDEYHPIATLNVMLRYMLGQQESLGVTQPIHSTEIRDNLNYYFVGGDHKLYTKKDKSAEASMTYTFYSDGVHEVYAYFPTLYQRACYFYVNGAFRDWMLTGSCDGYINLGVLPEGMNEMKVVVSNEYDNVYLAETEYHFYYLDEERFAETFTTLADGGIEITHFSEDRIKGTLTASEDRRTILTTIPYDAGWTVTVDGEEVETYCTLDTLLAFDVTPGEHEVDFRYMPREYRIGFALCAVGLSSFGILIGAEYLMSLRNKRLALTNESNEE